MIKRKSTGVDGSMTTYAFTLLNRTWLIALSENKWHAGEKYKRMPIWTYTIDNRFPMLFIWNVGIGYDKQKIK